MYLFKVLSNRLEYVSDGDAFYVWISGDKTISIKNSRNTHYEIHELALSKFLGDVDIYPDGRVSSEKKFGAKK